jgi:GntR family transcriptional regulator/MocR family aminotransferase
MPALDLFPWATWSSLVSVAARGLTREQAFYSDPMGLRSFREVIASYLRTSRNVRCESEQVLIVSGSQQALCLAATVLLNRGDEVWMEDPGYSGARNAFKMNGNLVRPVPVDGEGLQVEQGRRLFPAARLVYVIPSHQYPLGVTMTLRRRLELLDWADSNGSWIVEDDYDSEFRYVSRPLSSLQGLGQRDRVIYVGTFSKILFPSLRVGYMVVPADLVDRFARAREASDIYPATLYQVALTRFIQTGGFARHMRRMRTVYSERLAELVGCVERDLAGVAHIEAADSGMYVTVFLPEDIDDRSFCKEAARRGIELLPLSGFYRGEVRRRGLILGFGGTDLKQIRDGMAVLKKIL